MNLTKIYQFVSCLGFAGYKNIVFCGPRVGQWPCVRHPCLSRIRLKRVSIINCYYSYALALSLAQFHYPYCLLFLCFCVQEHFSKILNLLEINDVHAVRPTPHINICYLIFICHIVFYLNYFGLNVMN
jgi:hypothetical protein